MKMIRIFIFASLLFFSSIFSTTELEKFQINDPLLVVVLMVKNEADAIVPTLKPFVDGGVDAFFIFDTGSTDRTIENAKEYLLASNVRFGIVQEPFVDFATSRNRGLDLAQEVFPNSVFMLMPDAEWYIKNVQGLLEFCKQEIDTSEPAYLIRIASMDIDFYTPRLIRTKGGLRFVGEVHEVLNHNTRSQAPRDVIFDLAPSKFGQEKSKKRWERDLECFMRKYSESPLDTRNLFYLAQTLWCLDDLERAYHFYQIRARLYGWDEEDFLSWYRLGRITEDLAMRQMRGEEFKGKYSWAEAMEYYLKAFTMRPCRAEPIIRIAQHYLDEDNHQLSFIFALRAAQIPYPEKDVLMVEKDLYEYQRFEILCRAAWYLNEFDLGFMAACKCKQRKPELTHVQRNAQLYFDKLTEPITTPA